MWFVICCLSVLMYIATALFVVGLMVYRSNCPLYTFQVGWLSFRYSWMIWIISLVGCLLVGLFWVVWFVLCMVSIGGFCCWLFVVRLGVCILLLCCILLCGILCVCLGIVVWIWCILGGVLLGILLWFVGTGS